jgi:hypothetical protein
MLQRADWKSVTDVSNIIQMIFSTVINISISISRKHVNVLSRGPLSGKQNNHFDFCHSASNDLKPWKSMNESGDVSKLTTTTKLLTLKNANYFVKYSLYRLKGKGKGIPLRARTGV